ncbi:apolipoprotein N-acyltransferase [Rhodophyticola porphyridii]|uniref:apolipoprotein N-acyltransferase n=1 Tax=Rhodophyticola porphyridii TaxID=1852017 RepID=UPI0035D07304
MTTANSVSEWLAARSVRQGLALAMTAGAVGGLGQAPFDLSLLAVIGLTGLVVLVLRADTARRGFSLGLSGGAGYFAVSLHWIVEPFLVDPLRHGWMAPFALLFLAVGLALFWAVPSALAVRLAPGPGQRALLWTALLTTAEYARGTVLTGFPWAQPGHIWIDTSLLPLAAFVGPYGMTFYTVAAAALIAVGVLRARWWVLIVPGIHAGLVGLALTVPPAPDAAPDAPVLRLVQPNAAQHLKWQPDMIPVFFARAVDLTAEPPQRDGRPPALVIWPETSLAALLNQSEDWRAVISQAAGPVSVILGAQRLEGVTARNSLALLDETGGIAAIYDKHHLVPFGEYMPFGDLLSRFGIDGLAAALQTGYRPGPGPQALDLGTLGRAFAMICYEAIFPGYIRRIERPDWMVHITNDAWFGQFSGPYQHLALARLRAAEQGLPLVRAANTGISAVIDGRGRVLDSLPLGVAGALDVALPPALPPTLYARTGDWPVFLVILAALFAVTARRRVNRH